MASRRWQLLTAALALAVVAVISFSLLFQGERVNAAAHPRARAQAAAQKDARLAGAYRFERGLWTYVHLQGSPEQIGYQHGYLLAPEIKDAFAAVKLEDTHNTKHDWNFFHDAAQNALWPHIPAEYRAELKGIVAGLNARGVKMDLDDVVALNAFMELPDYYAPWYDKHHQVAGAPSRKVEGHCSAFVATGDWTKDHQIVMGHNNWTSYLEGERWRIIFDIQPEHGYRMIGDGFPGVIVSDDDFTINSDGLMVTETTISDFHGWNPDGIPEFVRAREAMQYAGSIDEYEKIMLKGNNGGYANDWLIGDRKTGEIARLELGLRAYKLYRTKNGYFVGSNFTSDPTVTKLDTTYNVNDPTMSPNARHVRWDELMKQYKGKIDVQLAQKFEADHYDAYTHKEGADVRTLCGHEDASPLGDKGWGEKPFNPGGAVQGKVTDSNMAAHMELIARAGHPCGENFYARPFLKAHPQFDWQAPVLHDMIAGPWTEFRAGEHPPRDQ
ncbi:MAG TPA: C45 family peptidase [Candidatus Acidoferrales bacterium]|nr:C45 family peptidase [Candidatus Acidoferrales bacterium]